MPLALDARAVRVKRLANADYVQARLVRQLLHQRRDLLDRFTVDALLAHSPVNWPKGGRVTGRGSGVRLGEASKPIRPRPSSSLLPAPLTVFGHNSGHMARPRVHVYYDPWVPSGEVGHLLFHELPEGPQKAEHNDL